jgi:hypothetical protein
VGMHATFFILSCKVRLSLRTKKNEEEYIFQLRSSVLSAAYVSCISAGIYTDRWW